MDTIKIVINKEYGGFGLSKESKDLYKELSAVDINHPKRHDPYLVDVIEKLGDRANGKYSKLIIELIPSVFKDCYEINEYDGLKNVNLSSCLLIDHKLKQMDVETMNSDQCKEVLLSFKMISSTNYYE